jgi:hypothetical protein
MSALFGASMDRPLLFVCQREDRIVTYQRKRLYTRYVTNKEEKILDDLRISDFTIYEDKIANRLFKESRHLWRCQETPSSEIYWSASHQIPFDHDRVIRIISRFTTTRLLLVKEIFTYDTNAIRLMTPRIVML